MNDDNMSNELHLQHFISYSICMIESSDVELGMSYSLGCNLLVKLSRSQ